MSFQPSKKSGRERAQRLNSWRPNWGEEGDEKKNDEDKEEADERMDDADEDETKVAFLIWDKNVV